MSLKRDLNRSLSLVRAEDALSRAETMQELQDAWHDHGCDDFAMGSDPHRLLFGIYKRRQQAIEAARLAPYLLRT